MDASGNGHVSGFGPVRSTMFCRIFSPQISTDIVFFLLFSLSDKYLTVSFSINQIPLFFAYFE
jgi:hypothetical protein